MKSLRGCKRKLASGGSACLDVGVAATQKVARILFRLVKLWFTLPASNASVFIYLFIFCFCCPWTRLAAVTLLAHGWRTGLGRAGGGRGGGRQDGRTWWRALLLGHFLQLCCQLLGVNAWWPRRSLTWPDGKRGFDQFVHTHCKTHLKDWTKWGSLCIFPTWPFFW